MSQSTSTQLSEIIQALRAGNMQRKSVHTYLAQCVDNLLHLGAMAESEVQDVLREYLSVLDQLIALLPSNDIEAIYSRSITALIRGDYQGYLDETEKFYAAKSAENPRWLDWFIADQRFVAILEYLPVLGNWNDQIAEMLIKALQKYAAEYCPKSAFDLYCKAWASKGSDSYRLRLLRDVLDKDPSWLWAWTEIGIIYYNQKKWGQALDSFQKAMKDDRVHAPEVFFDAAWSAEQIKNLDDAIGYYCQCIELDPAFSYAQNNLGWCLNRQKKYAEAEPYLRYAVEHDENKKYSCRNLFDSLERQGKTDELHDLVQQYPEHFRTKYYRERLEKIAQSGKLLNLEELQMLLQKTTTNDYAGTISVAQEQSGIRLYQHQKEAVQHLDDWKRQGDHGAGLLVLPTGGGKTLTATYWLMKSILDQGEKSYGLPTDMSC